MSLSDFTKQDAADIATLLHLAALTEDRTKAEQKALERLAAKVDKQRNRQGTHHPLGNWPKGATVGNRPACTYSPDHPKSCPCRGDGLAHTPVDGWSRLAEVVES